jgi:replicative DNA helicase
MSFLDDPLPSNEEAEQTLIGAIAVDNRLMDAVVPLVKHSDFYNSVYARVFRGMKWLWERDKPIDHVGLSTAFRKLKIKKMQDVAVVLSKAMLGLPHFSEEDIVDYCKAVKETSLTRQAILMMNASIRDLLDPENDPIDAIQRIETTIQKLNTQMQGKSEERDHGFVTVTETTDLMLEQFANYRDGKRTGVGSGMPELDNQLDGGGFQPYASYFLGALEKTGKTSLLLDWASHISVKEQSVVPVVTLEMGAVTMTKRLFSKWSGIPYYKFRPGMDGKVYKDAFEQAHEFRNLPIEIADDLFDFDDIERHLTRIAEEALRRGLPMKFGILDYLQLIQFRDPILSHINREQQVAGISRGIKRITRNLGMALAVVSSLNRSDFGEEPSTRNLRDSHQIAFDAEAVMFLHDPEYKPAPGVKRDRSKPIRNIDLILDRQRNGPTGTIPLKFVGKLMQFYTESQFRETFGDAEDAEGFRKHTDPHKPNKLYDDGDDYDD